MKTSEAEYYLISELISMPDRRLAQMIELHIWCNSPHPQGHILQRYLDTLNQSKNPEHFYRECYKILEGLEFVQIETGNYLTNGVRIKTQPKDARRYGPEFLERDKEQEGIKADQ